MLFPAVILFFLSTFFVLSPAQATGFVAPVSKDHNTRLYSIPIYLKTPLQRTQMHLDLGGSFTWLDCNGTNYTSSTYSHIPCGAPPCNSLGFNLACDYCYHHPGPTCANNRCSLFPENTVTQKISSSIAIVDALGLNETDGSTTSGNIGLLSDYFFSCAPGNLLRKLPKKSVGVVAFGRGNYSLPAQVSRGFSVPNIFALCLSSSRTDPGVAFVGSSGPYYFRAPQETDLSRSLLYTPLILNPISDTVITYYLKPSDEYFVG